MARIAKVLNSLIGAACLFAYIAQASAEEYITCESNKNQRSYCNIDHAYDADIRLSRRLSSSSCIEGSSWGRDNRGIWVDEGCRAEFSVYRNSRRGYDQYSRRDYDSFDRRDDARLDKERRDLEQEIDRTREARERLERENSDRRAALAREHCPAGFEPGNHRCSNSERGRGCKDMKMPGGTTCNSVGWAR